jgi:hypothetical protein
VHILLHVLFIPWSPSNNADYPSNMYSVTKESIYGGLREEQRRSVTKMKDIGPNLKTDGVARVKVVDDLGTTHDSIN